MNQDTDNIREMVRQRYADRALQLAQPTEESCCSAGGDKGPISKDLYTIDEVSELPDNAVLASLGCGNPTALAEMKPGEVVLDLGSGGGIDVLLSARRVGPMGKAYGLDMTDEMLELARQNQREASITNVEFLKGYMEDIPLPNGSVDVIISNCVVNLSPDKDQVLKEAFRVLRPGGRFAISDIVIQGPMPEDMRRNMELWCGCLAGALHDEEYRQKLAAAGFTDIDVEITRSYGREDLGERGEEIFGSDIIPLYDITGSFCAAFVRAQKPA